MAVVVSSLFGLGALLALAAESPRRHAASFCSATSSASRTSISLLAAGLAVVALAALRRAHRQLLLVGFDRASARALGGRPLLADARLLLLLALAVLVGVQALGSLLVVTCWWDRRRPRGS